jgi:hypothetical protein
MDFQTDEPAPVTLEKREKKRGGYHQGTLTIPARGTEFQYYSGIAGVRPPSTSLSSSSSAKEKRLTKYYSHHPMQQQQQQQQHQLDLAYLERPMNVSELLYEPTCDGNAWSHSNYAGADGVFRATDERLERLKKMSLARSMLRSAWEGGSEGTKLPRRVASGRTPSKKRRRKQVLDNAYEEADGLVVEKSGSATLLNTYALSTVGRCSEGLFFFTLVLAMVLAGLSFKFGDEMKQGLVRLTDNFRTSPSTLYCNVIMVNIAFEHGYHLEDLLPYQFYECIPFVLVDGAQDNHGDFSYQIRQLPLDFAEQYNHEILTGNFQMSIEGGEIDKQQMIVRIPDGAKMKQVRYPEADFVGNKEKLKQTDSAAIGDKKILVLRISTKDAAPRFPAKELYSYIFDRDQVSVTSQYEKCSFGKLSMQPTEYGVMDVNIGQVDQSPAALVAAATESARDQLGITGNQSLNDIADFVFYCLPAGTGHWAAYSGVNHWRSVYNDQWCAYQTGSMKELG